MKFRMNETAITSSSLFSKHFSPTEILCYREEAAVFMMHMLAPISVDKCFNAIVFAENAAETPSEKVDNLNYKTFPVALRAVKERKNWTAEALYFSFYFNNPRVYNLLEQVRRIADGTDIESEREKDQLFALLASAYLLAERKVCECPITSVEAQKAFRKEECSTVRLQKTKTDTDSEAEKVIHLSAVHKTCNEEPTKEKSSEDKLSFDSELFALSENRIRGGKEYKLRLRAEKLLNPGEIIEPRKIQAYVSDLGLVEPVVIEVYDYEGKEKVYETEIATGEYIFANFVGEELVCIHPTLSDSASCSVTRKDDFIKFFDKRNEKEQLIKCNNVVMLAAEDINCGFIGVNTQGAFYNFYSNRGKTKEIEKDIVQVIIDKGIIYLLNKQGNVYVNMSRDWHAPKYADLKDYVKDKSGDR